MNPFPFIGGSSQARSSFFDAQRSINLYPEGSKSGTAKNVAMLVGCPGYYLWLNFPGGTIRGMLKISPQLAIVVSGLNVYKVDNTKIKTLVGTIDGLTTPVSMVSNGIDVMIVTGPNGYFYNLASGVLRQIIDPNFLGADSVGFLDGYFIWNRYNTTRFQISGLYSTSIDGADIASAEGSPDSILALLVDHREAWMFGADSTEVFFNSGNPDFPIERIQGAFIEQGIAAKYSAAKLDNTVYWLSADARGRGVVQKAIGYQPQRCSTHPVETAIAAYPIIEDAVGFTYQQEGHYFYMLSFPSGGATWCYDSSIDEWHERAYRDPTTALMGRHRANCHMAFVGENLIGDYANGNVYVYDLDTYTDNGDILAAIRQTPYISNNNDWIFFSELFVDMEVGVGTVSGAGSAPKMVLEWSDDGGKVWKGQRVVSVGKIGERRARAIFRRLGKSRSRLFRVTVTDPVKRILINADVGIE